MKLVSREGILFCLRILEQAAKGPCWRKWRQVGCIFFFLNNILLVKMPFKIPVGSGDLDACLVCATGTVFVENSSGQDACPVGFCPDDLQACLQSARTMAAQIYGCHAKSHSKAHAAQFKPLLF